MILEFINLALTVGLSTTYGYNEPNCGDIASPRTCSLGAITASGEVFNPELPTAAVFAPSFVVMRTTIVHMQVDNGPCVPIRVNDKGNERFVGERGFDLTPRAVELLTGNRSPLWSGRVTTCEGKFNETSDFGSFYSASVNHRERSTSRVRQAYREVCQRRDEEGT